VDYASTAWFLAKYATSLCLLILSFNAIDEKEDFLLFAKVLILGSVVPILFGFYQKVTGYVFPWHEGKWWLDAGRISSLFGRWNEYGIYLSIILVLLTCVIINEEKTGRRWKWILWSGLAAISFVISLNRGSWIALALGFLVAFFAHMRRIQIRWYVIGARDHHEAVHGTASSERRREYAEHFCRPHRILDPAHQAGLQTISPGLGRGNGCFFGREEIEFRSSSTQ
jgi:hypothetical protein